MRQVTKGETVVDHAANGTRAGPTPTPWKSSSERRGRRQPDRHLLQTPMRSLCRQKVAIEKGWQTLRPTPGEVWNHLNANPHNCVGVVPSSLGFTVMDVDAGSPSAIALAAWPAVVIPSQGEGRAHLWYPDTQGRENRKWHLTKLHGKPFYAMGEIRSGIWAMSYFGPEQLRPCFTISTFRAP